MRSGFVSGVGFSDLAWMFLDSHLRVFLRQLPKIRDVLARIIFWGGHLWCKFQRHVSLQYTFRLTEDAWGSGIGSLPNAAVPARIV